MLKSVSVLLISLLLAGCFKTAPHQAQLSDPLTEPQVSVALPDEIVTNLTPVEFVGSPEFDPLVDTVEPIPVVEIVEPALPYYGDFPLETHPRVEKLLARYTGNGRRAFATWLQRAGRFIPEIQTIFAEEGVPLDLAYLAMIESGFNTRAYSWAHAAGPWQFIESTGNIYSLKNDWWRDERCDLEKSTRAAAKHLSYLHQRFDGNWYLAVAAYNAGGGKIRKAVKASDSRDFWVLADGKVLSDETRYYLPKLLAALTIVKNLDAYGFAELDFAEPLDYETVSVATMTDLEIIADFCGVTYEQIKSLNPNLKRWSTPPQLRNYPVHVPSGTAEKFHQRYAELPENQRASYHRHQIKSGDSLLALANKYQIQVADIIALNKIENPRALQLGDDLILPLREGFTALPVEALADKYVRTRRRTYTVRKGDSLWSISRRFDVSEKQLRVWNKLGWSNTIQPGLLLAVSQRGKANARAVKHKGKSYKVKSGDSLSTIAHKFNLSQQQLRNWNRLGKGNLIRVGQVLALSSGPSTRTLAKTKTHKSPASGTTYKVAAGDSLWTIGRRFNLSSEQLRGWNQLGENDFIQPGQLLALSAHGLPVVPVSKGVAVDATKYAGKTYRVRAGDSIWSIAKRYDLHGTDLQIWNQLGESDVLQLGQVLALSAIESEPVAVVKSKSDERPARKLIYKVLPGDSLWGIGQQFGVKSEMIRAWNDLSNQHQLHPGQTLTLLVPVSQQG